MKSLKLASNIGVHQNKCLTAIETTADSSDDNLHSQHSTKTCQDLSALVVDGMDTDDMDD